MSVISRRLRILKLFCYHKRRIFLHIPISISFSFFYSLLFRPNAVVDFSRNVMEFLRFLNALINRPSCSEKKEKSLCFTMMSLAALGKADNFRIARTGCR